MPMDEQELVRVLRKLLGDLDYIYSAQWYRNPVLEEKVRLAIDEKVDEMRGNIEDLLNRVNSVVEAKSL